MTTRIKLVIANWKMQLTARGSGQLTRAISVGLRRSAPSATVALCPSHPALSAVARELRGSRIALGCQDVFWAPRGEYTGEVSIPQVVEFGVRYVIVGHSERRRGGESEALVAKKLRAVIGAGLTPIFCVGETYSERRDGERAAVLRRELRSGLRALGAAPDGRLVVAYEPVWAIGTGRACRPADAAAAHQFIREVVAEIFSKKWTAKQLMVIYGGSVNSKNSRSFAELDSVDGVLVGGASLSAGDFLRIVRSMSGRGD